ncbi:Ltp family lipoprotein [Lacrimispora sp. NSJ-141]|uniref:Ltp family lipoprotein n=1 Tax=Lientehia hominis TaxID=2897778 RepID=A0AAP2RL19_9FIRM|nr:Ltp family lipoprotein [Lientehia hominis]MCD2493638.1 Ltp family lipoprotein [Lientehia hominis]
MKKKLLAILLTSSLIFSISACGQKKEGAAKETSSAPETETTASQAPETSPAKQEKRDFNPSTNTEVNFMGYTFSIPSNWTVGDSTLDTVTFYPETGDAAAMLQFRCQSSPVSNFEELSEYEDDFINGFSGGFDSFKAEKTETIEIAGEKALFIPFTAESSGSGWNGMVSVYVSHMAQNMFSIMYVCSDNTQYSYLEDCKEIMASAVIKVTETTAAESEMTPVETTAEISLEQRNALKKANDYLSFSAFSYTGLIHQLEFEGFSTENATYAADNCGADWSQQAAKKAKDYLSFSAFSYTGLINQLEFEGFSTEEAASAVDCCGADWNEQAAKKAQDYLDYSSFSRQGLIDQLVFEGFTAEQAEYGVTAVGY